MNKVIDKNNINSIMPRIGSHIRQMVDSGLAVQIEWDEAENSRSSAQNRLLWLWHGVSARHLDEHFGITCSANALHEDVIELLGYYKMEKGLNGFVKLREKTSKMGVKKFAKLLDDYDKYAQSVWGLTLPHPDDLYMLAVYGETAR